MNEGSNSAKNTESSTFFEDGIIAFIKLQHDIAETTDSESRQKAYLKKIILEAETHLKKLGAKNRPKSWQDLLQIDHNEIYVLYPEITLGFISQIEQYLGEYSEFKFSVATIAAIADSALQALDAENSKEAFIWGQALEQEIWTILIDDTKNRIIIDEKRKAANSPKSPRDFSEIRIEIFNHCERSVKKTMDFFMEGNVKQFTSGSKVSNFKADHANERFRYSLNGKKTEISFESMEKSLNKIKRK